MICSTTYRTLLSVAGSAIMMLGTFTLLKASAPWGTPRGELVRYHDADLNNPAKLYKRLHAAAERVCAPLKGDGLVNAQLMNACIEQAVGGAVANVNDPQLSALHSATIGRWQLASGQHVKPEA
jgi:UrcA family protein